jgi:hypothetical protein
MRASLGRRPFVVLLLAAGAFAFLAWRLWPLFSEGKRTIPSATSGDLQAFLDETPPQAASALPLLPRTEDLLRAARRGSPFAPESGADLERAVQLLELRGVLRDGNRSLVLVGRDVVRVGESVRVEGYPHPIEIEAVLPGRVRFRSGGRTTEKALVEVPSPGPKPEEQPRRDG